MSLTSMPHATPTHHEPRNTSHVMDVNHSLSKGDHHCSLVRVHKGMGGSGIFDEDMTPSDMNIGHEVNLFPHLHNDLLYDSLGSTCHY